MVRRPLTLDADEDFEYWLNRFEVRRVWDRPLKRFTLEDLAQVSVVFMERSIHLEDARYLNLALKLNDRLRSDMDNATLLAQIEALEQRAMQTLRMRLGL